MLLAPKKALPQQGSSVPANAKQPARGSPVTQVFAHFPGVFPGLLVKSLAAVKASRELCNAEWVPGEGREALPL